MLFVFPGNSLLRLKNSLLDAKNSLLDFPAFQEKLRYFNQIGARPRDFSLPAGKIVTRPAPN